MLKDVIDERKVICLVLLDLSMDHEYLLNLKYRFRVDGTVLAWLTDYLNFWKLYIMKKILFMGDINIHMDRPDDPNTIIFSDLLDSF